MGRFRIGAVGGPRAVGGALMSWGWLKRYWSGEFSVSGMDSGSPIAVGVFRDYAIFQIGRFISRS